MEWDDLRYVLATARSGSFLGASKRLNVTHTTVGRRVKASERDLGQKLFQRTRDGVVATDFCQTLLPTAKRIEREVQALNFAGAAQVMEPEGMVRVHTAHWIIEHVLTPALSGFQARFPKVRLFFVGDVVDSVADDSVPSLSLRFEVMAKRTEVETRLIDIPFSLYHSEDRDPETLRWVAGRGGRVQFSQTDWMARQGITDDDLSVFVNDAGMVAAVLLTGDYKGALPHFLARMLPRLTRVSEGPPDHIRRLRLIAQRRSLNQPEVQVTQEWLKDVIVRSTLNVA